MVRDVVLEEVERLYSELKGLLPLSEEQNNALLNKFRLEFNYNSNHIEGNTLTYGETMLLLIFDETRGNHHIREYEEMKASDAALEFIQQSSQEKETPLTEVFIKNLNRILLVRPYWKDATTTDGQLTKRKITVGKYKDYPNSVLLANGETFEYVSPLDTPVKMKELVDWFNGEIEKNEMHPVEIAAKLHYDLVRIHPFDDGNGRVARLLMNYVLLRLGYPMIVIKSEDKGNYLSALHDADSGNMASFITYLAKQLIWSLQLSLKIANNENIEEEQDWKKKLTLLKKKLHENETIKLVKSPSVIADVLNTKIKPFVLLFLGQFNEFDDLFIRKNVAIKVPKGHYSLEDYVFGPDNVFKQYDDSIRFDLGYYEFNRHPFRAFDMEIALVFSFRPHLYVLQVNGDEVFSKLYHQDFTIGEIDKLKNILGDILINAIEKVVNN